MADTTETPGETLRFMAIVAWFPALFTYLYAILMMYGDNPFRRMVNGVSNLPMKLIFAVAALISGATIAWLLWAGTPWWDAPTPTFLGGLFIYLVASSLWVPVIVTHLSTRAILLESNQAGSMGPRIPFPIEHFFMQRTPLVVSLVGAVMVIVSVWGAASNTLRVGLLVWGSLCSYNAFVWDLLYARWLLTPVDEFF